MTAYRLFPSSAPGTLVPFGGGITLGVAFRVTATAWLGGYWWYVLAGAPSGPQEFCLWQVTSGTAGALVPGCAVTSPALAPGWNFVPLAAPVALSQAAAAYVAATGLTGSFPADLNQFGGGEPLAGGITAGPLMAFSDTSGSAPCPVSLPQGVFSGSSADPAAAMPFSGNDSSNFWADLQVSDTAPPGASFRVFPSFPVVPAGLDGNDTATIAMQFTVAERAQLAGIWHYSPAGAGVLPSRCGIWDVASQSEVADMPAATWSGAAGSGWVSCTSLPAGIILAPATALKVATFASPGGELWFNATSGWWTTGPGSAGITSGILAAPSSAASSPGQGSFLAGAWGYPSSADGEGYWLDVEVTDAPAADGASAWLTGAISSIGL